MASNAEMSFVSIILFSALISCGLSQTFQYSRGWVNGKVNENHFKKIKSAAQSDHFYFFVIYNFIAIGCSDTKLKINRSFNDYRRWNSRNLQVKRNNTTPNNTIKQMKTYHIFNWKFGCNFLFQAIYCFGFISAYKSNFTACYRPWLCNESGPNAFSYILSAATN